MVSASLLVPPGHARVPGQLEHPCLQLLSRPHDAARQKVAHDVVQGVASDGQAEDNLNTHDGASLYEAFPPEEARRILGRIEFHYTPKHGSWLNMAETEINIMNRQ